MISMKTVVSHSIEIGLLKQVDKYAKEHYDGNRSMAIDHLLRQGLRVSPPVVDVSNIR
jgi:metal-responsive CopG/Arc/MetJ family transcriptional regulator